MATKNGKMTMRQFEKSSADKKMDKNVKEGSAADRRMDKAALAKINRKRGK